MEEKENKPAPENSEKITFKNIYSFHNRDANMIELQFGDSCMFRGPDALVRRITESNTIPYEREFKEPCFKCIENESQVPFNENLQETLSSEPNLDVALNSKVVISIEWRKQREKTFTTCSGVLMSKNVIFTCKHAFIDPPEPGWSRDNIQVSLYAPDNDGLLSHGKQAIFHDSSEYFNLNEAETRIWNSTYSGQFNWRHGVDFAVLTIQENLSNSPTSFLRIPTIKTMEHNQVVAAIGFPNFSLSDSADLFSPAYDHILSVLMGEDKEQIMAEIGESTFFLDFPSPSFVAAFGSVSETPSNEYAYVAANYSSCYGMSGGIVVATDRPTNLAGIIVGGNQVSNFFLRASHPQVLAAYKHFITDGEYFTDTDDRALKKIKS